MNLNLRTSEWIQMGFPLLLAGVAWTPFRPSPSRSRWNVTGLFVAALIGVGITLWLCAYLNPRAASVVRDWLPVPLFLIPYWQAGQFFLQPNPVIERRLLLFDQRFLPEISQTSGTGRSSLGLLLETAYLFCYPMVPLGVLALYLTDHRKDVAGFWLVVLVSSYICYAVTPFVPAFPPRSLMPPGVSGQTNRLRMFNRWILRHGSIHAISFPSAHVASAMAVAFVLLYYSPAVGIIFLVLAVGISLGAVIGRYHYLLDVLAGAVLALLVLISCLPYL